MKHRILIPERRSVKKDLAKIAPKIGRSRKSKIILFFLSLTALTCIVLIALPYLPRIMYLITKPKVNSIPFEQAAKDTRNGKSINTEDSKQPGNRLVLPAIGVNTQIIEGGNIYVIGKNQGVWNESSNINPSKNGNMVLAGHRFLYTAKNGGWFYNLPELKIGEKIYIKWDSKVYEYEIYNSKTVMPTQIDIRDNDPNISRKLTLYTCYPLGSTAKRYVVEAKQL